jgi:hypothetical protein
LAFCILCVASLLATTGCSFSRKVKIKARGAALSPLPTHQCTTGVSNLLDARCKLIDTGLDLIKGCRYQIKIVSKEEAIVDGNGRFAVKLCGLEGWDKPFLWPVAFCKRSPCQPYFALIAVIDGRHAGRIVEYNPAQPYDSVYVPPRSGRLFCYLNDWPSRYDNNHGRFRLRLTSNYALHLRQPSTYY